MPTLATFNANNFFLRYKFTRTYPGDVSKKSIVAAAEVGAVGYLPAREFGSYVKSDYIIWDTERRDLAARALAEPDGQLPDILCLQEVENIHAIRALNDHHLGGHYGYSLLIDGYDPRNIDVGVLSRFPIRHVRSHIDETTAGLRVFSRDCLEVEVALPSGETLTLLVNHLKSKFVRRTAGESDTDYELRVKQSHQRRKVQAGRVAAYVEERFQGHHDTALYAVVGDLNDTPESPWLSPLLGCGWLTDVLSACVPDDSWTYYYRSRGTVAQIDYVLASAALAQRIVAATHKPHIERQGLAYRELNAAGLVLPKQGKWVRFEDDGVTPIPPGGYTAMSKVDFRFPRYAEVVQDWRHNVSDHCPVKVWF